MIRKRTLRHGLAALLILAAGAAGALAQNAEPAADSAVLKVYDIGFLTAQQEDFPGRPLASNQPENGVAMVEEAPPSFLTAEDIVEAIRTNFHEDSWADSTHSIAVNGGSLFVVNNPPVHEAIAGYLAMLRARRSQQVSVEATLAEVTPAVLDAFEAAGDGCGLILNPQQRQILDAALDKPPDGRILQVARAIAFYGQRVSVRDARMRGYVHDYEIQVAEKSVLADPVPGHLEEGSMLDVRPLPEFGGARVTLEVRYDQQALAAALAAVDLKIPNVGLLHLPALARTAVRTNLTLPVNSVGLAGEISFTTPQGERRCLLLLMRPGVVQPVPDPQKPVESAEKRQLKMYDVGFLTRAVHDFPGPAIDPPALNDGGVIGATLTFTDAVEDGLGLSTDQLVELIKQNVGSDSWSNTRNRIWASTSQLMVVQSPEILQQIQDYLGAPPKDRGRMIRVDALVLALSGKYAGAGLRKTPFAQGAAISADALQALKDEAQKGADVRVLGQATIAGFNRQRVHALSVVTHDYVSDHDAQIATDSHCLDPVIGQITEGLVLDVRPTLVGDGAGILLDFRPAWAHLNPEPDWFDTHGAEGQRLQLPDIEVLHPSMNLTVREGEWTVAAMSGDATGGVQHVILVRARAAKTP